MQGIMEAPTSSLGSGDDASTAADFATTTGNRKKTNGKTDLVSTKTLNDAKKWEVFLQELVKFKDEHGHIIVPKNYRPNPALGDLNSWVARQKILHKRSKLSPECSQKLRDVGVVLSDPPPESENAAATEKQAISDNDEMQKWWDKKFQSLFAFKLVNGHIRVKPGWDDLHAWLKGQKELHHEGKLRQQWIEKLQQLGVDFSTDPLSRTATTETASTAATTTTATTASAGVDEEKTKRAADTIGLNSPSPSSSKKQKIEKSPSMHSSQDVTYFVYRQKYPLEFKLQVIQKMSECNNKAREVGRLFGINESSVRCIMKQRTAVEVEFHSKNAKIAATSALIERRNRFVDEAEQILARAAAAAEEREKHDDDTSKDNEDDQAIPKISYSIDDAVRMVRSGLRDD